MSDELTVLHTAIIKHKADEARRTYIDKSKWPRGEWDNEPDQVLWIDEATDLLCLINHNDFTGSLNGYVGVLKDHLLYGVEYSDIDGLIDVHMSLTFSGEWSDIVPFTWFFGFDCSHAWDYQPAMHAFFKNIDPPIGLNFSGTFSDATYKNFAFVKQEVIH